MSPAPEHDRIRLGIAAVSSPLEVGAGQAPVLLDQLQTALSRGHDRLEALRPPIPVTDPVSAVEAGRYFYDRRVDAICLVAACWFEDYLVLDMLEECDVPVIAWARPGMETGSLCGIQQLGFMLKRLGKPYLFVFDEVGAAASLTRTKEFASAAALRRHLRRTRIGHLGHRVSGMTETTVNELALKRVLGPRIVSIDNHLFLERAAKIDKAAIADTWQALKARVGRVTATEEAGFDSLQVYMALKDSIQELGLSAVAVGCYPHLMGRVCLAASLSGEDGIPVACEGDVNGALGMLLLTKLTGQPAHNTDLLDPIPADNSIVFSHCGSGGFSLASSPSEVTLGPVRLMDCGLCALFTARPGPMTLINIVAGPDSYRMAALFGEAVETEMVFPGNPLRVKFEKDYRRILSWIAEEGLGHHWMGAYGDLRPELGHLAAMTGCEWLSLA